MRNKIYDKNTKLRKSCILKCLTSLQKPKRFVRQISCEKCYNISFTRIFKANHGNKNMLLGKEFILWDLTQVGFQISASMLHNICLPFVNHFKRYIRGKITKLKQMKVKYKPIPKKIQRKFRSSLEFLLYDDTKSVSLIVCSTYTLHFVIKFQ